MICTTIEQSRRLLELGLDPKTADMHYVRKITDFMGNNIENPKWSVPKYGSPTSKHASYIVQNFTSFEILPAWSLSALLKVMPKGTNETYHLFSSMMSDQLGSWVCDRSKYYMDADGHNKNDYECVKSNSPVTAAYEMVCWLLEQGIIEKG